MTAIEKRDVQHKVMLTIDFFLHTQVAVVMTAIQKRDVQPHKVVLEVLDHEGVPPPCLVS